MVSRVLVWSAFRLLVALAVISAPATRAIADVTMVIADDGSERIVLANTRDAFEERDDLTGFTIMQGKPASMHNLVHCESLAGKYLERARSKDFTIDVVVARYNMVRLWTGRVCDGKADGMPTDEEAKAWLLDLAGIHDSTDGKPFLGSRRYLAEFYLFGNRNIQPDKSAFIKYVDEQSNAKIRGFWIYYACAYQHGFGVPNDPNMALTWIQRGADENAPEARALLAQNQELGLGVPRDEAAALKVYVELARAVEPPVDFRLGLMYLDGRGTTRDACEAKLWLTKAANHHWSPVPQAKRYLERIRDENLCPSAPAPAHSVESH